MGYVTKNLMLGEGVVYVGKVHWIIFVPGVILLVLAFLLFPVDPEEGVGAVLGTIALLIGIGSLLKAYLFAISTELAVTTKRVIAKTGFIKRNTVELNHSKVESFNVDQSITGRIFGFGTVVVCGTGGGKTPIPKISKPLEFRRQAMHVADGISTEPARA